MKNQSQRNMPRRQRARRGDVQIMYTAIPHNLARKQKTPARPVGPPPTTRRRGFTIVELLIVIAIIALLISIALPSFRKAREQAKKVATQSTITSISSSLELYRGEQALGTKYPPSQSDEPAGIDDPFDPSTQPVKVTGASLLVLALAGPDQNGTAGFFGVGGGTWASNLSAKPNDGELYDPNGNAPRYGPYAEGKLLESIEPIRATDFSGNDIGLEPQGIARPNSDLVDHEKEQRFFVDEFKRPILYYRARSAARNMITDPNGAIGIYDHRDNSLLTGGVEPGTKSAVRSGVQFTSQPHRAGAFHRINTTRFDGDANFGIAPATGDKGALPFDAYIIDPKSTVTARPVNPSTFLLISAGADGYYGTKDDVKNWGN